MKSFTAMTAILAVTLTSGAALAGGWGKRDGRSGDNYQLSQRKPEVRGFLFRPGGHRYSYENEPFLRSNGDYGNYPQLDPRNFKERVFSDPRFDTTSPSAF